MRRAGAAGIGVVGAGAAADVEAGIGATGAATEGMTEVTDATGAEARDRADERSRQAATEVPRISNRNRGQRDMNHPRDRRIPGRRTMAHSNEEVLQEIHRLRSEIQQLREIVSALFNAVFEDSEEEWEAVPDKDEFNLYN
jgi:hypothetical protein